LSCCSRGLTDHPQRAQPPITSCPRACCRGRPTISWLQVVLAAPFSLRVWVKLRGAERSVVANRGNPPRPRYHRALDLASPTQTASKKLPADHGVNPALEEAGEAGFSLEDPGVGAIVRCPAELARAPVLVLSARTGKVASSKNGGMREVGGLDRQSEPAWWSPYGALSPFGH
jgi:hypothetical protein